MNNKKNMKLLLVIASSLAIILSPLLTFLTGSIVAYSLVLVIPFLILVFGLKLSRKEIGFVRPKWKDLLFSILFPLGLFAILATMAALFNQFNFYDDPAVKVRFPWVLLALVIDVLISSIFLIVTEEGFFRGSLIAGLLKAGYSQQFTLVASSVIFSIWHITALLFFHESQITPQLMPIYLTNATVVAVIWGLIRIKSQSIWPTIISHAVWNTYAYYLFGVGMTTGLLGIKATYLLDPERGLVGLALSLSILGLMSWSFFKPKVRQIA